MNTYETAAAQRAADAAKAFADAVNEMGFDCKTFAQTLTSQHRTLQQNAMRAIATCMGAWAEMEAKGWYDPRNEATVRAARRFVDQNPDGLYLPFI